MEELYVLEWLVNDTTTSYNGHFPPSFLSLLVFVVWGKTQGVCLHISHSQLSEFIFPRINLGSPFLFSYPVQDFGIFFGQMT